MSFIWRKAQNKTETIKELKNQKIKPVITKDKGVLSHQRLILILIIFRY